MYETKIVIFKNQKIRKTYHSNEWWFVINDVIETLTDSNDPAGILKVFLD
jgi:DNA-damage-inducible protein D